MNRLVLLVSFSLISAAGRRQDTGSVQIHRDITYASPGNLPQKLDLDVPTGLPAPPPIVIYLHGRGWEAGSKAIPFTLPLTQFGLTLASIDYRLSDVAHGPAKAAF